MTMNIVQYLQINGVTLGIPSVGAVKHDFPHLADHPDRDLDHPFDHGNREVTAP